MRPDVREECGVFAIADHPRAADLAYYGLFALQHRGQESAGIAVAGPDGIVCRKGMGLVAEVFRPSDLKDLKGERAIGHVRYSTTGASTLANAQPLTVRYRLGEVALAHNGNLTNAAQLRQAFEAEGSIFQTTTDTEIVAHLMARSGAASVTEALCEALQRIHGGYALVALIPRGIAAARDPHGLRPLCLGRLDGAWVVASETCGLDAVGATFVREVEPGELVVVVDGEAESRPFAEPGAPALCIFEFVYLARPDSTLAGRNVHQSRKLMGKLLAQEAPADADVVIGVPDSSISAASGYAEEAGIPYEIGLIKNRYVGRTFIQPDAASRDAGVRLKLNVVREVVRDRRVVLVDDSLVRGTTMRHLVRLLRDAGARAVHVRIASPPYRFPCYYGVDTSEPSELVAAERDIEGVRRHIGADSLAFLSLDALKRAAGGGRDHFCTACFTGDYPVLPPGLVGKFALERTGGCG
ncbi:MAG: amidophosphoribosyltransferase [Clostridia bacterium]|nr:amidophosphoribosyltransferase [Clostridia bacterium]